jgi:hypothetical protein
VPRAPKQALWAPWERDASAPPIQSLFRFKKKRRKSGHKAGVKEPEKNQFNKAR